MCAHNNLAGRMVPSENILGQICTSEAEYSSPQVQEYCQCRCVQTGQLSAEMMDYPVPGYDADGRLLRCTLDPGGAQCRVTPRDTEA